MPMHVTAAELTLGVGAVTASRSETVRLIGHGETDAVSPEPVAEGPGWVRAMARLEMYGERRVREAYTRYGAIGHMPRYQRASWRRLKPKKAKKA